VNLAIIEGETNEREIKQKMPVITVSKFPLILNNGICLLLTFTKAIAAPNAGIGEKIFISRI
jgi:hypothetical protein